MQRYTISFFLTITALLLGFTPAGAHCEIPCGIYDDQMRTQIIAEHAMTIEKSMKQILQLQKEQPVNYNQLVRWISNKEAHATKAQHIISQYFMTQRLKPDQEEYLEKLAVLHQMLIAAMKCKQTTDLDHVDTLRALLKKFETLYFGHSHN
jgi:nickel superoxide dismutase